MTRFFIYNRIQKVPKKDQEGKPIPKKDEKGEVIQGQFEMEDKVRKDSFNIDKIIRSHMIEDDHVVVLLEDGHEETQLIPVRKNVNKPAVAGNLTEQKAKQWVQSEISIKGEDVARFYEAISK